MGENPSVMIDQGIRYAPVDRVDGSVLIAGRAASILAYAGDFTTAQNMARLASGTKYRESYPFRNLAITIHQLGGDHTSAFEESLTILSDELDRLRDYSQRGRNLLGLSVQSHIETAEAVRLFGGDDTHYLEKAGELLVEGGPDSACAYKNLASAYARRGDYVQARNLAGQIKHTKRIGRNADQCVKEEEKDRRAVYAAIAYSQAGRDNFSEAIESASECGEPLVVCNIFLQQANQFALMGEDPSNAIQNAVQAAIRSQPGEFTFFNQPWKVNNYDEIARIYAEAARIQALAGINPAVSQHNALINGIQSPTADSRLEALLDITPTLSISGSDPNSLLRLALNLYDDSKMINGNIGDLLDIHQAALFSGTTEFIDPVGKRLTQSERETGNRKHNRARNRRPRYTIQTAFAFTRWAAAAQ